MHLGVAVGRVTCVCVYQIFVRSFHSQARPCPAAPLSPLTLGRLVDVSLGHARPLAVGVGLGPAEKFLLTDSLFPDLYCC